jgi:hypothetical protein
VTDFLPSAGLPNAEQAAERERQDGTADHFEELERAERAACFTPQPALVRASLLLADKRADRHNTYPRRNVNGPTRLLPAPGHHPSEGAR